MKQKRRKGATYMWRLTLFGRLNERSRGEMAWYFPRAYPSTLDIYLLSH
jgi:hypothetical protein